jgi:hypothetical protein
VACAQIPTTVIAAMSAQIRTNFTLTTLPELSSQEKQAANYNFTSALAVQMLKDLTPTFLPVIKQAQPERFTLTRR